MKIEAFENLDQIIELAEEFNAIAETIAADQIREGLEYDHNGSPIHIHTPWAVGALSDAED